MKKGQLDFVAQALADISKNRLPLKAVQQLNTWTKWVEARMNEREEIRQDFLKQYLPEGKDQVTPEDPGFDNLAREMEEFFNEDLENPPAPIDSKIFPDTLEITVENFIILDRLEVIK